MAEIVTGPEVEPPGGGVSVPGPVTVTPTGVEPTHVAYVFTGDKKPPMDVTMIMAVVLRPCATVKERNEAEREKVACVPCVIVNVNVMAWLRLPLVPKIWNWNVPIGAKVPALIDIVEVPGVVGFGEKAIWTPEGTLLLVESPT